MATGLNPTVVSPMECGLSPCESKISKRSSALLRAKRYRPSADNISGRTGSVSKLVNPPDRNDAAAGSRLPTSLGAKLHADSSDSVTAVNTQEKPLGDFAHIRSSVYHNSAVFVEDESESLRVNPRPRTPAGIVGDARQSDQIDRIENEGGIARA